MALIPYRRNNSNIVNFYNPFRMMDEMEREFFGDRSSGSFNADIRETDTAYVLEADLPGFKKEDIKIDLSDNTLTIQAERHSQHEEKDQKDNYIRCERSYGSFSRSFSLDGVDTDNIKASFDNGVLTLNMPKLIQQQPESRRLEIE